MKLGKGLTFSGSDAKKNAVLAVVLAVVIVAAGYAIARNFMGPAKPPGQPTASRPPGAVVLTEEQFLGPLASPGASPNAATSAQPASPGGQPPTPAAPGAQSAVAPPESPQPAASPAPEPKPAKAPAPAPKPEPKPAPTPAAASAAKTDMRQIKVFGSVNVSYPAKWKISAGTGNTFAVFTDGDASFTVHAADPTANSAKRIAQAAMKALTPGAVVTAQGTDKIAGHEAQWFAVRYKGKLARVVGIDGPNRIALVQTVKSGDFAKYRETFNQMQSAIRF